MKILEKYKKYLSPINIYSIIIFLLLFILPLVLGIAPIGKWWAYIIYFVAWAGVLFLFFNQKIREWYKKIFK